MKNENGLTLIELVVTVAVLSIVILPFFGIFTNAAKLDERSKNDMTANYLAQQLAEEARNEPFALSGDMSWTRKEEGTAYIFTKSDLDGAFSKFSAQVTYEPLSLSVSPNGLQDAFSGESRDYSALFEFTWNNNDKTISCAFENEEAATQNITDTANDIEINLENGNEGINSFRLEVKINSSNPLSEFKFNLPPEMDAIRIKSTLDPASSVEQKSRTITVANNTRDKKDSRAISLLVDTVNFTGNDNVDIVPKNKSDNIVLHTLVGASGTSGESGFYRLTVEIKGYDPIAGTKKVLKKLITSIRIPEE